MISLVVLIVVCLFIFRSQTDATMTELEIDMNMRIGEWSIIQESGKELVPCHGPGYTGLVNLGNSCYLNSVMQVMFSLPEFKTRYVHVHRDGKKKIFRAVSRLLLKEIFRL